MQSKNYSTNFLASLIVKSSVLMTMMGLILIGGINNPLQASAISNPVTVTRATDNYPQVTEFVMDDFNGDRLPDIAMIGVSPLGVYELVIAMNNGDGTFQGSEGEGLQILPTPYTLLNQIHSVDIDGDGDKDIAILSPNLGLLVFNGGTGLFSTNANSYVTLTDVNYMTVMDMNLDGLADIVACTNSAVKVYYQASGITFSPTPDIDHALALTPSSFLVAKVGKDPYPDIAFLYGASTLEVLNFTIGGHTHSTMINSSELVGGLMAGDVDHDGDVDLVSLFLYSNGYVIFLNSGTGAVFTKLERYTVRYYNNAQLSDFDYDGDLELIGVDASNKTVFLANDIFAGSVTTTILFLAPNETFEGGLRVIDYDCSGKLNIVVFEKITVSGECFSTLTISSHMLGSAPTLNFNSNGGSAISGTNFVNQNSSFSSTADYGMLGGVNNGKSLLVDLDNDGDLDQITATSNQYVTIYINDGSGTFSIIRYLGGLGEVYGFAVGDINKDGWTDLVISFFGSLIKIYFNQGDGTFSNTPSSSLSLGTIDVELADLNNDGWLDIVASRWSPGAVYVFLSDEGSFLASTLIAEADSGAFVSNAFPVDLDCDGILDIVYNQCANNSGIRWVKGNGNGTFGTSSTLISVDSPWGFRIADLDGDGHLDIMNGSWGSSASKMSVFWNNGSQVFTQTILANSLEEKTMSPGIADMDRDGDMDIVGMTNLGVVFLRNDGNRIFTRTLLVEKVSPVFQFMSTDVGDLDNDGDLDFATSIGGDNISYVSQHYVFKNSLATYSTLKPADPTREGYTFGGWYSNVGLTTSFVFNETITITTTVYAKWNLNEKTISFNENGGTVVNDITGVPGASITWGEISTKAGYTFSGWYTDDGTFLTGYSIPATVPSENVYVYAKWTINQYTVSFDSNGGSSVNSIVENYNTTISAPLSPTKTGYLFEGWYTDNGTFVNRYIFTTMPSEDITLFARWTIVQYTITFDSNGGSSVSQISANYDTELLSLPSPTKTGYTFDGWHTDDGTFVNLFELTRMPAYNETLYAKWTLNEYTISFDTNGGNGVNPITKDYGESVSFNGTPNKTGYTFAGWYTDDETFVNAYTFSTMPAEDVELHAKWVLTDFDIIYTIGEGGDNTGNPDTYTMLDETITLVAPTREGYSFAGWYSSSTFIGDAIIEITSGTYGEITLYAKWIDLAPINQFEADIDAIPTDFTLDQEQDVIDARASYDALSEEQKALLDSGFVTSLEAAEQRVLDLKAAKAVEDLVSLLEEKVGTEDEADIEAARNAYDNLTAEQKSLFNPTVLDTLVNAEHTVITITNWITVGWWGLGLLGVLALSGAVYFFRRPLLSFFTKKK